MYNLLFSKINSYQCFNGIVLTLRKRSKFILTSAAALTEPQLKQLFPQRILRCKLHTAKVMNEIYQLDIGRDCCKLLNKNYLLLCYKQKKYNLFLPPIIIRLPLNPT